MSPRAAPMNVYQCDVPSVRMQVDPIPADSGLGDGYEKDKWSTGWFGPIFRRVRIDKNAVFAGNS